MTIILSILGMFLMFYLLAKVCDQYFVRSLEIIAQKWHLSEDVAGATLMAIGSSAPEFFTAVIALTKVGSEQIGTGTIVGSAIFNVLVIIGASSIIATVKLRWGPVIRDLLFYIAAIVILLLTFRDGIITIYESLLYILVYIGYIVFLASQRKTSHAHADMIEEEVHDIKKYQPLKIIDNLLQFIFPDLSKKPNAYWRVFIISIVIIALASWALVEFAIVTAHSLGIPEVIIALTILAGGTSIPDLLSSVIVAKRGKGDMAVSNAVGSNTFDILVGLGVPWFVYTALFGGKVVVSTENLFSSILLLFFTVVALLFLLVSQRFKIGRKSGYFLIAIYVAYVIYSIYGSYHPEAWSLGELFFYTGEVVKVHSS
jgi:K+-dependent Na+/Ca+ exchanger-like protein